MTGRFIVLEGIDGAGKDTVIQALQERLEQAQQTVVVTREPGGTVLAERIRALLLDSSVTMAEETELLLMFAARAEHIARVIRPSLAQGAWVLCRRFSDSSFAYQGAGRGIDVARIDTLVTWTHGDLQPDRVLLLDLAVATALSRVNQRGEQDRIEAEDQAFFQRVRQAFLDRAAAEPQRFAVVDASLPREQVQEIAWQALQPLLPHG